MPLFYLNERKLKNNIIKNYYVNYYVNRRNNNFKY